MSPLVEILGGLGLFLYGMAAMTSGLRVLAGDRLRQWLSRSTRTPLSGVITGAIMTAIVQSSSATTVAVVGFVGAGLLTFAQALGVMIGANIGTTITGWMVALVGFKLHLSVIALPLVFVAAILYLFKSRRLLQGSGQALAGFCLIFLGIGYLQGGLTAYESSIDLSQWRVDHLGGRGLLVIAGGLLTLITQSSSATVATALTALNASVLSLPQAAAVIIGADIGTTATAALATIGGTAASKRTGFAHVIYNVMTGMVAFLLLPGYLWMAHQLAPKLVDHSSEVVAVAFHTFFNVFGVLLVLPFTKQFATLIKKLFPSETDPLTAPFDDRLLADSHAALDSLRGRVQSLAVVTVGFASDVLSQVNGNDQASKIEVIDLAIGRARTFALRIGVNESVDADALYASLHCLDHVERLLERSRDREHACHATELAPLHELTGRMKVLLGILASELSTNLTADSMEALRRLASEMEDDRAGFRADLIAKAVEGKLSAVRLDEGLDSHRWLRRMAYHTWRIAFYQHEPKTSDSEFKSGTVAGKIGEVLTN